jgi:hypothetical protein
MAKYPGLLAPTQGDKMQALYQGLLKAGPQMSQGYTTTPTSFMQGLTAGGAGFQKGYGDQIALTKADQLQNMQAQSAQAQIAAQEMNIEEAKRLNAERERQDAIGKAYYDNQMGPMTAERRAIVDSGGGFGLLQSDMASKAAAGTSRLEHERALEIKRMEHTGKSALSAKDKLQLGDAAYNQFNKDNKDNLDRMAGYRGLEAIYKDPAGNSTYETVSSSGEAVIDGTVFSASNQGARDMALIFSVMKMLDPGSTVREGEFALAANASGKAKATMNFIKKMWSGDQLPQEARQQLMSLARGQYDEAHASVSQNLAAAKERMGQRMPSLDPNVEFGGVVPDYTPAFGAAAFDPTVFNTQPPPTVKKVAPGVIRKGRGSRRRVG